jgi:hypothetical protein
MVKQVVGRAFGSRPLASWNGLLAWEKTFLCFFLGLGVYGAFALVDNKLVQPEDREERSTKENDRVSPSSLAIMSTS